MIDKFPLESEKLRRIPKGFGWVDHRLLRNGYLRLCSPDSLALYLVLICAADGQGLSYYGDSLICTLLGFSHGRLESARQCLINNRLIAYDAPLYQVLEVSDKNSEVRQ